MTQFQNPPLCSDPSAAAAAIGVTTVAVVAAHLGFVTIGAACRAAVDAADTVFYPKLAPVALAAYQPVLNPLAVAVVAEGNPKPIPETTAFGTYIAVPRKASISAAGLLYANYLPKLGITFPKTVLLLISLSLAAYSLSSGV